MARQRDAEVRHANHYKDLSGQADHLYLQGGEASKQGLSLFDQNWGQIRAGFEQIQRWASHDPETARLCSDYLRAAPYCLDYHLTAHERIEWLESALRSARQLGDQIAEARHIGDLGLCYFDLADYPRAAELQRRKLDLARKLGDRQSEITALNNLGNAYHSLAHLQSPYTQMVSATPDPNSYIWRAIACHRQALLMAREDGDLFEESLAWRMLGRAYATMGLYTRAIKYLEHALGIAKATGHYMEQHQDLLNLGNVHKYLGRYKQAIGFYEEARTIQGQLGRSSGQMKFLNSLGSVYKWSGNYRRALETHQEELALARLTGDLKDEVGPLLRIASTYFDQGDLTQAVQNYEQALAVLQQTNAPRLSEATTLVSLGHSYLRLGQKEMAAKLFSQSQDILSQLRLSATITLSFGLWLLSLPNPLISLNYYVLQKLTAAFKYNEFMARFSYRFVDQKMDLDDDLEKLADLTKAIARAPQDSTLYAKRGVLYIKLKNFRRALADFSEAIQLNPKNSWYYNEAAFARESLKNYSSALDLYTQALNRSPKEAYLWSNRGLVYYKLGHYDECIEDFGMAIKRWPRRARYYSHRGLALHRLGRCEEAQVDFAKALSLKPDNNVYCDLAVKYVLEGKFDEMMAQLRLALQLDRQDTIDTLLGDPDFDSVRDKSEFQILLEEYVA